MLAWPGPRRQNAWRWRHVAELLPERELAAAQKYRNKRISNGTHFANAVFDNVSNQLESISNPCFCWGVDIFRNFLLNTCVPAFSQPLTSLSYLRFLHLRMVHSPNPSALAHAEGYVNDDIEDYDDSVEDDADTDASSGDEELPEAVSSTWFEMTTRTQIF
jgi:hypothetical protein